MNLQSNVTLPADAPEFVLTRIFAAPRELVYKCWMDPGHMARWFGPRSFTCPVCEIEPRVGGKFRLVIRAPDGTDYPMRGTFLDIVPNERIVKQDDVSEHTDEWHDMVDPARKGQGKRKFDLLTTVTFEDEGEGTKVTIVTRFESIALRDGFANAGMKEGWNSGLDKLDDLLEPLKESPRTIVFSRLIDAPRDVVFNAFRDRAHIGKWWGPNGFTTTTREMDVRVGGQWLFTMHGPDGTNYPNRIRYTEIREPELIAYDHDDDGAGSHSFKGEISLTSEGTGTRVTLRLRVATPEERDNYVAFGAVEGGWQTLARLAQHLQGGGRS